MLWAQSQAYFGQNGIAFATQMRVPFRAKCDSLCRPNPSPISGPSEAHLWPQGESRLESKVTVPWAQKRVAFGPKCESRFGRQASHAPPRNGLAFWPKSEHISGRIFETSRGGFEKLSGRVFETYPGGFLKLPQAAEIDGGGTRSLIGQNPLNGRPKSPWRRPFC